MRIHRISGVRLDMGSTYWAQLDVICQNAMNLGINIFTEALKESYLFYDCDRQKPLQTLLRDVLVHGELHFAEKDGKIIGYAAFKGIYPGMYAGFEVYILPEYRKSTVFGEFVSYLQNAAFKPFPEGLQLHKVKAYVHPDNLSCLNASKRCGFFTIAKMPFEGLFNGVITPMLYLELYAPEIRKVLQPQVIENGKRSQRTKSNSSDLYTTGKLPQRTIDKSTSVRGSKRKLDIPASNNSTVPRRGRPRKQSSNV